MASWQLTQDGTVAGHLCHLYKRMHKAASAIEMCQLAVYRIQQSRGFGLGEDSTELAAAQENLKHLTTAATKTASTMELASRVNRERTFKLPRFLPGTESAEFFVLLAADPKTKTFKVEDVKFISGSDKMKLQGKQLKSIDFHLAAPGNGAVRFARRGILGCYQYTGCAFVVMEPATVRSVN